MKKILSFITMLMLVAGILPAGVYASESAEGVVFYDAADDSAISAIQDESEIYAEVTFTAPTTGTANVIAAYYNENGSLAKTVVLDELQTKAGETVNYTTSDISAADAKGIKIFVWEDYSSPSPILKTPGTIVKMPELPTATITELDIPELTFAMNFKADEITDKQLAYYKNWYADYVLTTNKDVTFNANGNADGWLSGQYDAWSENWINVPFESATLKADTPLKIMETAAALMGNEGARITYKDIYTSIRDFDCGVFFDEEYLAANPDLKVTLELRMYNPEDDSENYRIGRLYEFSPVTNTPADGNTTTQPQLLSAGDVTAEVPAGVLMESGADELVLTLTDMETSESGITAGENEELSSMDIHIEGVSKNNTTPIIITLKETAPKGLNKGNLKLYHVENGETVEMEEVETIADLTKHNQFTYDPLDGTIVLALATFSEIALLSDTENAWNGTVDTDWYNTTDKEFKIANADQLAGFGQIVGGMAEGIAQDSFAGKTITLNADINLGDDEKNNDTNKIFYPIGYYFTLDKNGDGVENDVYSTVNSFEGTFDGNGNTISNFYQNTWEMKGDYNDGYPAGSNHYSDAMGLFGYVVEGTVKNLTVDNFSSDGEFTPTGVIAAYAVNSTFNNIAITNCNPRVYNTGNGGIVGIGGNSDDPEDYELTFTNITIDNSNKITALWGSWDVACGGLVGMFRGAGHAYMTNCHVAAQMDVFNDVCGNYQYYWYRYAGMMIGTNKNMVTDANGYTVPETSKFHAKNCTVHFGSWNDYYYCELVANSLASYTHDHQFSRLEQISSLDEIKEGETWTKAGNFLLISDEGKTCYHIVNKNGVLTQHNHEDEGYEVVNGATVLKENNQIVYLPFNQLFTGYGWGVKHIPVYNGENYAFDGITILDREVADSVEKFAKADTAKDSYTTGESVTIGELFSAAGADVDIKPENVQVTVSPADETSTASATYEAYKEDWTQGTLTFAGIGAAKITITDYYFCTPTTINVTVEDLKPVDKFVAKTDLTFTHTTEDGTIVKTLGDIFEAVDGADIDSAKVVATVSDEVACAYEKNESDWTKSTLSFPQMGNKTVTITITDNDLCNTATATVTITVPENTRKFVAKQNLEFKHTLETIESGTMKIELGSIFSAEDNAEIGNVSITGNDVTFTANNDWTKSTITFRGTGSFSVTIDDDNFCEPTTATVTIAAPEPVEKFGLVFENTEKYMYRVGNAEKSTVALSTLFKELTTVKSENIVVTFDTISGNANGSYTAGAIQFTGTGIVKVAVTDNFYCIPTELTLEVVDAVNATSAMSATANNVVLLKDASASSFNVSGGHTFHGNGFTVTFTGDGSYRSPAVSYGFVTVEDGGILDNVQIICDIFPKSYLYTSEMTPDKNGRYPYGYSAVVINGNSTISNCYIYGARNNIFVGQGDVTIENTVTECGSLANIHIKSTEGNTVTLDDVTTIQYQATSDYDKNAKVLGFGVVVGDNESVSNPTIKLKGDLKQYNWVTNSDTSVSNTYAKTAITEALKVEEYQHTINDTIAVNMGIAYLNGLKSDIVDERENKESIPYELNGISISGYKGQVYSIKSDSGITEEERYDANTDEVLPYLPEVNGYIPPEVEFDSVSDSITIEAGYSADEERRRSKITVDLDNVSGGSYVFSFGDLKVKKYDNELKYTVTDSEGSEVDKSKTITLNQLCSAEYTLTITDNLIFDVNGKKTNLEISYAYPFVLSATKTSIDPPKFTNAGTATAIRLVEKSGGDWRPAYTVLTGVSVTYWSASESKVKTVDLSTLYNSGTISNNVWTYTCDDYTLTITGGAVHSDGTLINPVVANNTLYFASTNKAFTTGTTSRSIILTYAFTDKNASTTWNRTETVTYSNLSEYDYNNFKNNGTLTQPSSGGGGCVTPETLITLADGSQKEVQDLTGEEMLLVWNLETGAYDVAPIVFNYAYPEEENDIITLKFSDGKEVNAVYKHGFFDVTLGKYVYVTKDNAEEYIGHKFAKEADIENDSWEVVVLENVAIEKRVLTPYSPITYKHLCFYANGVLSIPGIEGLSNIFEVDTKTMSYDKEKMAADIETYGLFTYADFEGLISETAFDAFNCELFKISIGKGMMTWDDVERLVGRFEPFLPLVVE